MCWEDLKRWRVGAAAVQVITMAGPSRRLNQVESTQIEKDCTGDWNPPMRPIP